jgi:hypothetical protein
MLVLICHDNYLDQNDDLADIEILKELQNPGFFKKYYEEGLVCVDGKAMHPFYDAGYDALYWIADLSFISLGITTKAPDWEGKCLMCDSDATVIEIDVLHGQPPVLYVI